MCPCVVEQSSCKKVYLHDVVIGVVDCARVRDASAACLGVSELERRRLGAGIGLPKLLILLSAHQDKSVRYPPPGTFHYQIR